VVDQACQARWTVARICGVLELDPTRVWRWRQRAAHDRLDDQPGGGNPVHALTPAERAEIVEVAEE
jgi:transposase-like protein